MGFMQEKTLIFIPYQDSDNFFSDGIMTREFAMLYMLWKEGYKNVINIKKPRTLLDKKHYKVHEEFYPDGTKEACIRKIVDHAQTVQYLKPFSLMQIIKRRVWWKYGYKKNIDCITLEPEKDYLVYSDNPYAVDLLESLSQRGCKVYFDIMDNFAIHPSLNEKERHIALDGYKRIFQFANVISANSKQTCNYMQPYSSREIILVKNGVFLDNKAKNAFSLKEVKQINEKKKNYKRCAGYIGKLGMRLDADLIDRISEECKDVLFVFVGAFLKSQMNKKLEKLFKKRENILHLGAIPSAYVYSILDEFDILLIPHSVGKNENGGDPLKLYQYLTRNKPIITTPILGVEEFNQWIAIKSRYDDWKKCIYNISSLKKDNELNAISWTERIKPVLSLLKVI